MEVKKQFEILLVDDNEADIMLAEEAFSIIDIPVVVHTAKDGEEALNFLSQTGDFIDAPRPDIILLDINMPRKNGLEVLKEVKSNPILSTIPVIMLTTSDAEVDIHESYINQASSYITKPVEFSNFCDIVKLLSNYMLNVVRLPTGLH